MKKSIYIIGACCLMTMGCDKKLDQVDPNNLTNGGYYTTKEQAYGAVTAIYNGLITDGTYQRSLPGLQDSRGDDFAGDSPWGDLELTGQFIIPTTSGPVEWIWRDLYIVVNRANQALENVGAYSTDVLPAAEKDRLIGQAHFLRGFAYYTLATNFKTVPVITTSAQSASDFYPATATEEVLWNQIFTDLAAAQAKLPVSYASVTGLDAGQKGRATKGAATGLLGKAYLYRKDYAKAAAELSKFFSGELLNVYSLMPNYADNFKDVNENNAESLFEIQFDKTGGTVMNWTGNPSTQWRTAEAFSITYGMEGAGFSDYLPTTWIYNEFKQERTTANKLDPRLLATIASYEPTENSTQAYGRAWFNPQNKIYPRKYTYDGQGAAFEVVEGGINYRILRFADILLMYAEALNELNRTAEAYPFIQRVRSRAGLPDLATTKPGLSQAAMRNQIAHERALEFSIEGQRIHDIIRWGWLYDAAKLAELKAHDKDFNTWTPGNEYLPIPQRELDVNKNLKPNPAN